MTAYSLERFVHLGDLHLQSAHQRNADRLAAFDMAIVSAVSDPVPLAAWLMPGDLFNVRSTPDDRNALAERLAAMANAAPVVLCYGNHDQPGDLGIFSRLHAEHVIHVASSPGIYDIGLSDGTYASFFVLPYPSKAGLVSAGLPHDQQRQAAFNAFDLIFMDAAGKLDMASKNGRIAMMVAPSSVASVLSTSCQSVNHDGSCFDAS